MIYLLYKHYLTKILMFLLTVLVFFFQMSVALTARGTHVVLTGLFYWLSRINFALQQVGKRDMTKMADLDGDRKVIVYSLCAVRSLWNKMHTYSNLAGHTRNTTRNKYRFEKLYLELWRIQRLLSHCASYIWFEWMSHWSLWQRPQQQDALSIPRGGSELAKPKRKRNPTPRVDQSTQAISRDE